MSFAPPMCWWNLLFASGSKTEESWLKGPRRQMSRGAAPRQAWDKMILTSLRIKIWSCYWVASPLKMQQPSVYSRILCVALFTCVPVSALIILASLRSPKEMPDISDTVSWSAIPMKTKKRSRKSLSTLRSWCACNPAHTHAQTHTLKMLIGSSRGYLWLISHRQI